MSRRWMKAMAIVVGMGLAAAGTGAAQETFQSIGDGGYYRCAGNVGFASLPSLYRYWTSVYADGAFTMSSPYSSVMPKEVRWVTNIIDVPAALRDKIAAVLSDLQDKDDMDLGDTYEFIFPYKRSTWEVDVWEEGYLLTVVYPKSTWGWLDCSQAWFVLTK